MRVGTMLRPLTRSTLLRRTSLLMVLLFCHVNCLSAQQLPVPCKRPLTEDQLNRLLTSGVADVRIQALVSQCGIDFQVTSDVDQRLRTAGASGAVLQLIRVTGLRRKLDITPPAKDDARSDLALDEARAKLVRLRTQIHDIEARLRALYPGLQTSPAIGRSAFETTADYEARLVKAAAEHEELASAFKRDLGDLTENYNNEIGDLLSRQYVQPGMKVRLTNYDADNQLLFAESGNCNYWFDVPAPKAQKLYEERDKLSIRGNLLKAEDDRSEVTEVTIWDPSSNEWLRSKGVGPNFSDGFSTTGLTLNECARVVGKRLQLSGPKDAASSAYWDALLDSRSFLTEFGFRMSGANSGGFTLVLQNGEKTATGWGGAGLGYEFLPGHVSVAVKFDCTNNPATTGLLKNAESPRNSNISPDLNLCNGHVYRVHAVYDGKVLSLALEDTSYPSSNFFTSWAIDIPGLLGSSRAYVGFTAGTATGYSVQEITNWSYIPSSAARPLLQLEQ